MRLIGLTEVALEKMCKRTKARVALESQFQLKQLPERIAEARIAIDQIRLQTFNAAYKMDTVGNKEARMEIAMIKVALQTLLVKL